MAWVWPPSGWRKYCWLKSYKEGTETSRPVASFAVPQLNCRVTGSAPQWKHELMRCTCCLLYPRCGVWQPDAKYRMPMSIGSFSYTRSGLVSLARSQFVGHRRDVSVPSFRERGLHTQPRRLLFFTPVCIKPILSAAKSSFFSFNLILISILCFSMLLLHACIALICYPSYKGHSKWMEGWMSPFFVFIVKKYEKCHRAKREEFHQDRHTFYLKADSDWPAELGTQYSFSNTPYL